MTSKSEKLHLIHQDAIAEFERIQTAMRDERLQCLQDRRFATIAGAQWEGPLGSQFENKPRMEFNKIHMAVMRIESEYRNNRISVSFASKDGEGAEDLADSCASLYRADEQDSTANEAYDNAFQEALLGGFGAFRLCTEYEDEEDEDDERQRIRIEPIFDADNSVFFDLNAKRQDKADAKTCYVLTAMPRDAYMDEYGDDPASWPKQIHQRQFDWLTPDVVYVAEYYKVEEKSETFHIFRGLDGSEKKIKGAELEDMAEELDATGFTESRQKTVKRKAVHKYILNGAKVLKDCGIIAGRYIPVVPVFGKRWYIDNVERCMGHVRLAKDAQRLKNMQLSKLAEISALSSIEKPIFSPEQVAGHQVEWSEDHIKNYPYMLVNQVTDVNGNMAPVGPAAYTRSPQIPPAMAALLQLTEQDMAEVLGNQQQADKMVSNISGKAVEMIQTRLDTQTFIYMSNFAKAIKRAGEIWLSMAKEVYVEDGRKMKGVTDGDQVESIELRRPVMGEDGEIEYENDMSQAEFDVAVDVGPSSDTKRASVVRALTGMMGMTQDPELTAVLANAAIMNMEGEGLKDIRAWSRKKMLMMGAATPTDEEAKEMQAQAQNVQPDPQAQYLQSAAEEADAKAMQAKANAILTIAKSKETEVKIAEMLSNMSIAERDNVIRTAQALREMQQPAAVQPETVQPDNMGE